MVDIKTGHYVPVNRHRVTVWPAPDANGDGKEVWESMTSADGQPMGRKQVRDNDGRPVKHYEPPAGFVNVPIQQPGSNGQSDCYLRTDENGRVWRHPVTGEAVEIRPGRVLVEEPNGDFRYLDDEYSVYLYRQAHDETDSPEDDALVKSRTADREAADENERVDREAFETWKAERAAERKAETEETA